MDAFLRELRERVHIGVVGGSDYAKIAEQLGEGDEGERGRRGLPGSPSAKSSPEAALAVAGRVQAGAAPWLPVPVFGGLAGMLQSMPPAPASILYELPQSSDSSTPARAVFASLLLHGGVPAGSSPRSSGGMGYSKEWEGKGAAPASSAVFSGSGMDDKRHWAPSSAFHFVSGGRPRNSRLRLIAESPVLRVWVGGRAGVR